MTTTYAVGQRVTATLLQALADATVNRPSIRLIQQAGQALASGTATAITFAAGSHDAVVGDSSLWHDVAVNNTRVTPTKAGYYTVKGTVSMAVGATNYTQLAASVGYNGTRIPPQNITRPSASTAAFSNYTELSNVAINGTTDYFELYGTQTSGGSNNTNAAANFQSVLEVIFDRPL